MKYRLVKRRTELGDITYYTVEKKVISSWFPLGNKRHFLSREEAKQLFDRLPIETEEVLEEKNV